MSMQSKASLLLLTGLSSAVAVAHYCLHRNSPAQYQPQAAVHWSQPTSLTQRYPKPIGNQQWGLPFVSLEPVLQRARYNHLGELIVNPDTLEILQQASAILTSTLGSTANRTELQRMLLLVEKGSSQQNIKRLGAKELGRLLVAHYHFHVAEQADQQRIRGSQGGERLSLLRAARGRNLDRQIKFFGAATAMALFPKENARLHYLLDRQITQLDPALSAQKKRLRLKALETDYKASFATH